MKVAALDLGSNTFLCLIAEVESDKITKIIHDTVQVVRLGQDVDKTKRLHPEALLRAESCLGEFKKIIDLHKPDHILAMATSAARDSENRQELFQIGRKLNIPIEVIPGEREAEITFQGALSGQSENKNRLIIDIGGGSTEFIVGDLKNIFKSQSLDIGCVRLTEKFIKAQPTPAAEIENLDQHISAKLAELESFLKFEISEILAVAGTPTALAAATLGRFDPAIIDGYKMSYQDLMMWKSKLIPATVAEKIEMGIPEGRADVILVGVQILLATLAKFKKEDILVSTRGVRHGIALEMARRFNN